MAVSRTVPPAQQGHSTAARPRSDVRPMAPAVPRPVPPAADQIAPAERLIEAPADTGLNPVATLPPGAIPMMPSISQDLSRRVATAGATPAVGATIAEPPVTPKASSVWQVAPEPLAEASSSTAPLDRVVGAAAPRPVPLVELRMPDVDLSRDADSVFAAARAAGSGETVRPDAPDRRQVVLVAPSRVTMLRSCPAPGSLAPEQLVTAERLAGATSAKNIAAIAYTDLDAMSVEISRAIPFFDLLSTLGYMGHAVWIFEGHVSAMAAGCRDADILIVDDGMMPYLPGNWRSVATRSMRGADIHLFERKTGSLRRLV